MPCHVVFLLFALCSCSSCFGRGQVTSRCEPKTNPGYSIAVTERSLGPGGGSVISYANGTGGGGNPLELGTNIPPRTIEMPTFLSEDWEDFFFSDSVSLGYLSISWFTRRMAVDQEILKKQN